MIREQFFTAGSVIRCERCSGIFFRVSIQRRSFFFVYIICIFGLLTC